MNNVYTKSGELAKRIYFGATLIWAWVSLYAALKTRAEADGGTFEGDIDNPTEDNGQIILLTPAAYKAEKLYALLPEDGSGDFTVDRNSTATRVNAEGLIEEVPANVPRIDHSTGEPMLLVEGQSTNKFQYSEPIAKENVGSGISYQNYNWVNGFTNCLYFEDNTVDRYHYGGNFTQGITHVLSCFLEMEDGSEPSYGENGSENDFTVRIGNVPPVLIYKKRIEGGNVWHLAFSETNSSSSNTGNNGVWKKTTHSAKSFRITGLQLEEGTKATSYIPTNGSTVTRLADNITVPTPTGVTEIKETLADGTVNSITDIPATYQIPEGEFEKIEMI